MNWKDGRIALLILLLGLIALHAPALFQGKTLGAEDVLALFWADKYRVHNLGTGLETWSNWDPLPFLGMPRLANAQIGWFDPTNLIFVWLAPLQAWRFYGILSDFGLLMAAYYFLRTRSSAQCAWLAAGFYTFSGDCLRTSQSPPVKSALIAMFLILACHDRWLRSGRRRYLVGLAGAAGWQILSCAVSQLYYQYLSLPFFFFWQVAEAPKPRGRRGVISALVFVGATLACSFPWFPLLEWSSHGSRNLVGGTSFSEAYRYTVREALMTFSDETLVLWPTRWEHGGGYPLMPGFSLAVLAMVLYACRRRSHRIIAVIGVVLAMQMLGEQGVLLWILHKVVPFTQQLRGPHRFIFCASLAWVQAAALGLDELLRKRPKLAWSLALWALFVNFWVMVHWLGGVYSGPETFAGVPLPPGPGRVVVNYAAEPKAPLFWLAYPLTQGRPTLMIPHSAVDGSFFRGMLYSQYGLEAASLIPKLVFYSTPLPPRRPQQPLLKSWGLSWVLQPVEGNFGWQSLGAGPRFSTVVQVQACPDEAAENAWAERSDWKPFQQACLAGPVPSLGQAPARVVVRLDTPDEQRLETEGEASLLVVSDNWDPGWECSVDEQPVEVRRANLALKACLLPAGHHQVHWRYRPSWMARALPVVGAGLVLLLMAVGLNVLFHIPVTKTAAPDQL